MAAIEKAEDLLPKQKCHWCSSLRQMARYLDRPLSLIPTRIAAIGPAVKELHPARLGVKPKTFANHRANAKAALLWFNRQTPDCGRKAPMDPRYRSLLEQVEDRYAKDMLSPFFRFLSAHGIRPDDVRDDHVESLPSLSKRNELRNGEAFAASGFGPLLECLRSPNSWMAKDHVDRTALRKGLHRACFGGLSARTAR